MRRRAVIRYRVVFTARERAAVLRGLRSVFKSVPLTTAARAAVVALRRARPLYPPPPTPLIVATCTVCGARVRRTSEGRLARHPDTRRKGARWCPSRWQFKGD